MAERKAAERKEEEEEGVEEKQGDVARRGEDMSEGREGRDTIGTERGRGAAREEAETEGKRRAEEG